LKDGGFPLDPDSQRSSKIKTVEQTEGEPSKQPRRTVKAFDERLQDFIEWKAENGTDLVPQSLKPLGVWVQDIRKMYNKYMRGEKIAMNEERIRKLIAAGFVFDGNAARREVSTAKKENSA